MIEHSSIILTSKRKQEVNRLKKEFAARVTELEQLETYDNIDAARNTKGMTIVSFKIPDKESTSKEAAVRVTDMHKWIQEECKGEVYIFNKWNYVYWMNCIEKGLSNEQIYNLGFVNDDEEEEVSESIDDEVAYYYDLYVIFADIKDASHFKLVWC